MQQTAERSDIWLADQTPSAAHAPAGPHSVSINSGVTANRLIDCMAVSPSGGEIWRRAFITNVEKANRTPATSPEPTAATMVRMRIVVLVMGASQANEWWTVHGSESQKHTSSSRVGRDGRVRQ